MWALFFGGIDERYYKINQIYGYFIYEKANRLYDIFAIEYSTYISLPELYQRAKLIALDNEQDNKQA